MNSKKVILITEAIIVAIFNILVFILPVEKNMNFWVVYVSTMISIILTFSIFLCTLTKKSVDEKVKNLPLDWVARGYFIIQIIASIIELTKLTDYQISILINVIILGITAIMLVAVGIGKKEIERVDQEIKEKVFQIKDLQNNIDSMIDRIKDANTNKVLKDLSEAIRYSDPMSHSDLSDIDNKIEINVKKMHDMLDNEDVDSIGELAKETQILLADRNRKVKLYKGRPEPKNSGSTVNNKAVAIISVSIIVLIIVAITVYLTVIVPNKQRKEEEEKQQKAYTESQELLEKQYNEAKELLNNKKYMQAEELFEKIQDYKESKTLAKESIYQYAEDLLNKENYDEAIQQYEKISDYKDCENKITEVTYSYATTLYNNKEYSKAAEQFLKLNGYKDSKEKVVEIFNLFGEEDVVYFGMYNNKPIAWQVLDTRNHKALLIAKDVINEMAYNTEYKSITWGDSTIKQWLNGTFYDCFDENEKNRIIKNADEIDKVFLLSNTSIKNYPKLKKASSSWWIKTSGSEKTNAMYIEQDGTVNTDGDIVTKLHGVRPAIWLNLD